MNSLIFLNEADQLRLHSIIDRSATPPFPDPDQTNQLHDILTAARQSAALPDILTHVGFGDLATLISPLDSQDYYRFRIVMPHESDVDQDHISVCMPIATAVLGRPVGERVSWPTPAGLREMRIISVRKSATSPASHSPS
ncbi:MAG: GreA/GreB family elongation factor [Verrucomicrobiota bacterium]